MKNSKHKTPRASAKKRKPDKEVDFSALWEDAVETSLDDLETELHKLAKAGDVQAITYILKWRRRSVYNDTEESRAGSQNNYFLNVTLQEQLERLERLGLPAPVIEPDYEVFDDAGDDTNRS